MARVLVVEDTRLVRYALTSLLLDRGHLVTEASDGKRAIDLIDEDTFDVVVTDVFMPERDGIEVIRYVRETHPEMGIIAISGGGSRQDPETALSLTQHIGADVSLQKPVDNSALIDAVDRLASSTA